MSCGGELFPLTQNCIEHVLLLCTEANCKRIHDILIIQRILDGAHAAGEPYAGASLVFYMGGYLYVSYLAGKSYMCAAAGAGIYLSPVKIHYADISLEALGLLA